MAATSRWGVAEIPHTLPWYFGLAILAVWVTLLVLIARVGRHLLASRAERRARTRHHPRRQSDEPRGELTS